MTLPILRREAGDARLVHFPLRGEIGLVQGEEKGRAAELAGHPLLQFQRLVERDPARPIGHQQVAARAAEIGGLQALEIVVARQVPDHERDFRRRPP